MNHPHFLLALLLTSLLPSFALAEEPGDPRQPALYGTWTTAPFGLVNPSNLAFRTSQINSRTGIVVVFPQQEDTSAPYMFAGRTSQVNFDTGIVVAFPRQENTTAPYMNWKTLRSVRLQGLANALSRKINFDFDSASLEESDFTAITEMATLLKENPDIGLHLDGHTDLMGAEEYNDVLAAKRTAAVEVALLSQGVEQERLFVAGHGETMALIRTETKERENRRVEFAVVDLFIQQ
jgi:outer membrane protein OmpA-like peptidoglycan-associated protein